MSHVIKILVVDDESVGRNLLEAILRPEGYELIFGTNGEEALEAIIKHKPDIVLCDVMMPRLDGFGVAKKLRENEKTAHIPFLLITALDDRDSLIRGIEAGADDYISKPFNRLEILAKVKNHINLLGYRLGKTPSPKREEDAEWKKYAKALTHVFDDNFVVTTFSPKAELLRVDTSYNCQDNCSKIKSDKQTFYLHISNKKPNKNSICRNILIQKCFENNAQKGEKSPGKLISMVFDDLSKLSSQFGTTTIDERDIAIAVISLNELNGTCVASGVNQMMIAEASLSSTLEVNSKKLRCFDLKNREDIFFANWSFAIILSASAYSLFRHDDLLNQLNEHYFNPEEMDIHTFFSPIFTQTKDLLVLRLSF